MCNFFSWPFLIPQNIYGRPLSYIDAILLIFGAKQWISFMIRFQIFEPLQSDIKEFRCRGFSGWNLSWMSGDNGRKGRCHGESYLPVFLINKNFMDLTLTLSSMLFFIRTRQYCLNHKVFIFHSLFNLKNILNWFFFYNFVSSPNYFHSCLILLTLWTIYISVFYQVVDIDNFAFLMPEILFFLEKSISSFLSWSNNIDIFL